MLTVLTADGRTLARAELTYGEDYTVACSGGVEPDAGGVMTFTQVGPYTITVTPVDAGDFTGEPLVLTYTLLPAKAEGGLLLNDGESGIYTYGDDIDGTILVETQDGAEIDPKEFGQFIGEDIKLVPVTIDSASEVRRKMEFCMGSNTPERREYIMENLV